MIARECSANIRCCGGVTEYGAVRVDQWRKSKYNEFKKKIKKKALFFFHRKYNNTTATDECFSVSSEYS